MITIRLATIDDAAECLAIYTPYVEGTAISFEYAVPSIDDFRSRMDKTLTDDPYLTGDSVRFHEAMDYHRVGEHRRCGFKFGRWYHVIWMEKELGQQPENPEPFIPFFALDTK